MKKVALITGAAADIGKAIALRFAEKGYRVAACDYDKREATIVCQRTKDRGGDAIVKQCDISDLGQVEFIVAQMLQDLINLIYRLIIRSRL